MTKDNIITAIKSYKHRMTEADERAIRYVRDGSYSVAMLALGEAMQYKACIEELEFQLEVMEAENE